MNNFPKDNQYSSLSIGAIEYSNYTFAVWIAPPHQYHPECPGYDTKLYLMVLFNNPSARAGYNTRSIFKWSLTGFNSEFSFS